MVASDPVTGGENAAAEALMLASALIAWSQTPAGQRFIQLEILDRLGMTVAELVRHSAEIDARPLPKPGPPAGGSIP